MLVSFAPPARVTRPGEIASESSREHPSPAVDAALPVCQSLTHVSFDSEPEAAAVHCAYLTDLHKLRPSQNFMICDAGGGTVVSRPFPI